MTGAFSASVCAGAAAGGAARIPFVRSVSTSPESVSTRRASSSFWARSARTSAFRASESLRAASPPPAQPTEARSTAQTGGASARKLGKV